jgi:hypothetical protein
VRTHLRLQQSLLLVDCRNLNRFLVQQTLQLKDSLVGGRKLVLGLGFNLLAVVRHALPVIHFTREFVGLSLKECERQATKNMREVQFEIADSHRITWQAWATRRSA